MAEAGVKWSEEAGARLRHAREDVAMLSGPELMARVGGGDPNHLYKVERGERPPGRSLLRKLAAELSVTVGYLLNGDPLPALTHGAVSHGEAPVDPYAAIRARSDFQALPPWAQSYWAAQVATYAGSRQTDRRKLARYLDELDAVIADVESGKLTEANAIASDEIAGVAPTPPKAEPPPAIPLAKGLDAEGRPKKSTRK